MKEKKVISDVQKFRKRVTRPLRYAWIFLIAFFVLFLSLFLVLRFPRVQNYIASKTTLYLSEKFNTKVTLDRVDINLLKGFELEGFYLEDLNGDTLIYAGSLYSDFYNSVKGFYSKQFNIQGIYLENGQINLRRTKKDPLNNLQRLFNQSYDPYYVDTINNQIQNDTLLVNLATKPKRFELNLTSINLSNIVYSNTDSLSGIYQKGFLEVFTASLDTFDLKNLFFVANDLTVVNTNFIFEKIEKQTLDKPLPEYQAKNTDFRVKIKNLAFDNLKFKFNDKLHTIDPELKDFFDPHHFEFNSIDIIAKDVVINSPYFLDGVLKKLSLKSNGIEIQSLSAEHIFIEQRKSGLENFSLKTGRSELKNNLTFKYRNFTDWTDFVNKVIIDADASESLISLKDLLYFAPKLKSNRFILENLNQKIVLSTKLTGRVNQLNAQSFSLNISNNLALKGSFIARDLTNPDESLLNISLDRLKTDVSTLSKIIPGFNLPQNFYKLNKIDFEGRFDGYYQDFVAYGKVKTDMGFADVDMRLNLKKGSQNAEYSGKMNLYDFDLANWIENKDFGKLSLSANVDNGRGLELKTAFANIGGEIISFEYKNYDYQGIIDATIEKNLFDGSLKMNDENIKFDFLGNINLQEEVPLYDFEAKIEELNLQKLNLSKDITHISGIIDIKLKGSNIDNIIGSGLGNKIEIVRNNDTLDFGHLALASTLSEDNLRSIFIDSDIGNGEIIGEYKLKELPDAVIAMVKDNYPSFGSKINYISQRPSGQVNADFKLNIDNASSLVKFFTDKESVIEKLTSVGKINYLANKFDVNIKGPKIQYAEYSISNLDLTFKIDEDNGRFTANIDTGLVKKAELINVFVEGKIVKDSLYFGITSDKVLDSIRNIVISGKINAENDKFVTNFNTLNFDVLGDRWRLQEENKIKAGKEYLELKNFNLTDNFRSIKLRSTPDFRGIETDLKDIQLFLVNKYINQDKFILNGNVSANIKIDDIFQLSGVNVNGKIEKLKVNDQSMGTLNVKAETNIQTRIIDYIVNVDNYTEKLKLNGNYKINENLVEADLNVEGFKLIFLENFLGTSIQKTQGTINGKMHINGKINDLNTVGKGEIINGYTEINYLGTKYSFEEAKFVITKNYIDFTGSMLRDSRKQVAFVNGGLTHENFKKLGLDVNLNSSKFTLLETDETINPTYYGLGIGSFSGDFYGPFTEMKISITATTDNESSLVLPIAYVNTTRDQSFVPFIKKEEFLNQYYLKKEEKSSTTNYVGLTVEMFITVNPKAEMTILFDPVTGHKLTGTGSGDIQFFLSPNGEIKMIGKYEIDKGNYDFALQNIIKKQFAIRRGGVITWTGDPIDAQIKIAADYKNIKAPLNIFLSEFLGNNEELALNAEQDQDVKLTVNLLDRLLNPTIKFDIEFPNLGGELKTIADSKLAILSTDPVGLNNQVFGLLIFNNFLPYNNPVAGFNNQAIGSSLGVIINELLSAQVSTYVSSLLETVLKEDGLIYDVDVDVRLDNGWGSTTSGQNYGFSLNPKFNNDRFDIVVGGDFISDPTDIENGTSGYASGDFIVDYYLNKDKKLKVRIYGKADRTDADGRRQRYGAGLYVRREFSSFKDLRNSFKNISKELKKSENK